jgi:RNA polymerase-binding transcription factor DksA
MSPAHDPRRVPSAKESSEMTVTHINPRELLLAERERQLALVAEHDATATELLGNADVDSILERELALSGAARASAVLADIDAALEHIDDGTYGTCEVCSGVIPRPRLEAIPHARRCAGC